MAQYLLEARESEVEFIHVRLAFSQTIGEVGKPGLRKIIHLIQVLIRALKARFSTGARILYFPPAGPNLVPVLRDLVILLTLRRFFAKTVFHFEAAGLGDFLDRLPTVSRWVLKWGYYRPDVAVVLSPFLLADAQSIAAKTTEIIPNGIPDVAGDWPLREPQVGASSLEILFVGMVCEEKGVMQLLEATGRLATRGCNFTCRIVGAFSSEAQERLLRKRTEELSLGSRVQFAGPLVGEQKWEAFRQADIFCFPTAYPSEAFPLVLLEAMMASLPIVTTRWRGIPDIVDEDSSIMVAVGDSERLADALASLIETPALRRSLGFAARRRYLKYFQVETYQRRLCEVLAG